MLLAVYLKSAKYESKNEPHIIYSLLSGKNHWSFDICESLIIIQHIWTIIIRVNDFMALQWAAQDHYWWSYMDSLVYKNKEMTSWARKPLPSIFIFDSAEHQICPWWKNPHLGGILYMFDWFIIKTHWVVTFTSEHQSYTRHIFSIIKPFVMNLAQNISFHWVSMGHMFITRVVLAERWLIVVWTDLATSDTVMVWHHITEYKMTSRPW